MRPAPKPKKPPRPNCALATVAVNVQITARINVQRPVARAGRACMRKSVLRYRNGHAEPPCAVAHRRLCRAADRYFRRAGVHETEGRRRSIESRDEVWDRRDFRSTDDDLRFREL